MVHVLQHQNTYSNDPSVNGSSRATLLSKGSAEFIHGSDDIGEVLNAVGTGTEIGLPMTMFQQFI